MQCLAQRLLNEIICTKSVVTAGKALFIMITFLGFVLMQLQHSQLYWTLNHMATLCCSIYPELPITSPEPLQACWHFKEGLVITDWHTLYNSYSIAHAVPMSTQRALMLCSIALAWQYVDHSLWIHCSERRMRCMAKPVINVFSWLAMAAWDWPAHCRLARSIIALCGKLKAL